MNAEDLTPASARTLTRTPTHASRVSAYFASAVSDFLAGDDATAHAQLTQPHGFTLTPEQLGAWKEQVPLLRDALRGIEGWIYIEFDIPRLGRRVDAVLVTDVAVVPIEFKVGATSYSRADIDQAWDYGLELKNFHAPSHCAAIFPLLCATAATTSDTCWDETYPEPDRVRKPFRCNAKTLSKAIRLAQPTERGPTLTPATWGAGNYSPTPTIIEAARSLYARHTVHDITRNDAGAENLSTASERVESIIADARRNQRKTIIFLTGVPGAGKTLVGLNVATRHDAKKDDTHAVLLSGNGPLVAVLREALARDEFDRRTQREPALRKPTCRMAVQPFIQNVHHFRDSTFRNESAPADHIVVFDEAQRAWNADKLGRFMKQRRNTPGIIGSEPKVLLSAMDRHADWAAVLCLVGGGQEINTGEAGISAWIDALADFPKWDVHLSPNLSDSEYSADASIKRLRESPASQQRVTLDPSLHLSASMRSFRTEKLSHFVRVLLEGDAPRARSLHDTFATLFPIRLTRSMRAAREWIGQCSRGSERAGLLASSSGLRLKPHAVDVRVEINPIHWFLGPPDDPRSSQYLEDAATEFQIQGLELDWTIVAWDADLRRGASGWTFHNFHGADWTNITNAARTQYLKNAYRVLLTRARQGMVIFVPKGRRSDRTRPPRYYDGVYEYLKEAGVRDLSHVSTQSPRSAMRVIELE